MSQVRWDKETNKLIFIGDEGEETPLVTEEIEEPKQYSRGQETLAAVASDPLVRGLTFGKSGDIAAKLGKLVGYDPQDTKDLTDKMYNREKQEMPKTQKLGEVAGGLITAGTAAAVAPAMTGGTLASQIFIGCGAEPNYKTDLDFSNDKIEVTPDGRLKIWGTDVPIKINNNLTSSLGGTVLGRCSIEKNGDVSIQINKQVFDDEDRSIERTLLHELKHCLFRAGHVEQATQPDGCTANVMSSYLNQSQASNKCWTDNREQYIQQYHDMHKKFGKFVTPSMFNKLKAKAAATTRGWAGSFFEPSEGFKKEEDARAKRKGDKK